MGTCRGGGEKSVKNSVTFYRSVKYNGLFGDGDNREDEARTKQPPYFRRDISVLPPVVHCNEIVMPEGFYPASTV